MCIRDSRSPARSPARLGSRPVPGAVATPGRCCSTPNAPRGAPSYSQFSWEKLEGRFLGPMAYPDPKGDGDKSMPGKRRSGSGVRDDAPRDPRDMAEAGLPDIPTLDDAKNHPSERYLKPAPCSVPTL